MTHHAGTNGNIDTGIDSDRYLDTVSRSGTSPIAMTTSFVRYDGVRLRKIQGSRGSWVTRSDLVIVL
jgi:hypothetical protein